jgi:hypothetical protein
MKTWLWTLLVVAGGYVAYRVWFVPDGPSAAPAVAPVLEVAPPGPAAAPAGEAPKPPAPGRPAIDLGVESPDAGPAAGGEAGPLAVEWRAALGRGDIEAARQVGERIVSEAPESDAARWVHYERGREALRRYAELGRTAEGLTHAKTAWLELTPVLFARDLAAAERDDLRARLGQLAQDLLFTRHVEGMDRTYVPKRGDSLSVLCSKVFPAWGTKVSPGLLVEINRLGKATNLRAGAAIRVPIGEPQIIIVRREFRLYYLFGGGYVRDYPVGLGREGTTPEGTFVIEEMIRNPDWHPRAGVVIPYGHPENILGSRWMAFKDTSDYQGFGIHGTTDPASIGKEASSGCVRMLRDDVEQLFEWTPRGAKVVILR